MEGNFINSFPVSDWCCRETLKRSGCTVWYVFHFSSITNSWRLFRRHVNVLRFRFLLHFTPLTRRPPVFPISYHTEPTTRCWCVGGGGNGKLTFTHMVDFTYLSCLNLLHMISQIHPSAHIFTRQWWQQRHGGSEHQPSLGLNVDPFSPVEPPEPCWSIKLHYIPNVGGLGSNSKWYTSKSAWSPNWSPLYCVPIMC